MRCNNESKMAWFIYIFYRSWWILLIFSTYFHVLFEFVYFLTYLLFFFIFFVIYFCLIFFFIFLFIFYFNLLMKFNNESNMAWFIYIFYRSWLILLIFSTYFHVLFELVY